MRCAPLGPPTRPGLFFSVGGCAPHAPACTLRRRGLARPRSLGARLGLGRARAAARLAHPPSIVFSVGAAPQAPARDPQTPSNELRHAARLRSEASRRPRCALTPTRSPPGRGGRTVLGASGALLIQRGRGGAAPTERTSEGGWVGRSGPARFPSRLTTRPCARSSGMGVWGAQPPIGDTRSLSELRCAPRTPSRPAGGGTPSPPALTLGAREPDAIGSSVRLRRPHCAR